ncbi:MAG: amino acid ABC transporter permease [Oscillospiraceae bacterium]|nr:amino acid ABC transporter permease [Oscillospiraceae bacterium]
MELIKYILKLFGLLSEGLGYTLALFFITIIASMPLGLLLTFCRNSKFKPLRYATSTYVWVMRGSPLMLQLYFFYYGLAFIPIIKEFLTLDRFPAACIAFALNYAAYFCEIFRGGMLAIDKGQHEAAKVLGFSKWKTLTKIIIPQMIRVTLPSISNECITLVKDTALITAIGVTEILYFAKASVNRDVDATAYLVAAIFYLLMNLVLTKLFDRLEKKYAF